MLFRSNLCNPHWGEQVRTGPDNRLVVSMVFQGISAESARAAFQPLIDFAKANAADYEGQDRLLAFALPARHFWDADFMRRNAPFAIRPDTRPGASPNDFWWTGDSEQVGAFWHGYTSAWMPAALLK